MLWGRRSRTIAAMTVAQDLPEFDILALDGVCDPYPLYAEWRRSGPLIKAGPAQWGVTRHADVAALLRDRRVGHAMPREYTDFVLGHGPSSEFRQNSLLMHDGPGHLRLRRLMSRAFTPGLIHQLRGHIADLVDTMIEPLLDGAPGDIVELLAFPLPTTVICELLGIVHADREEVRHWSARLFGADRAGSDAAVVWMRDYLDAVLVGRRPDPDGDLLQRMLAAGTGEDALTRQEIVDNAVLLFFAGFETTRHLIASGAVALLRFPDERVRLWAQPDLSLAAVEEFLRYDGPVRRVSCVALEPVTVGDRVIREGRVLHLLLGSANHDDAMFEQPERLVLDRAPNPHLSFGGGPHRCLGMHLARLEGGVVFRRLAERLATFEAAGPPARETSTFGSWGTVPVRGRAR